MGADAPTPGEPETSEEEPVESSIISWAEVYRVSTCGGCNKTDCPHCVNKFLKHLNHQGTTPKGPLE